MAGFGDNTARQQLWDSLATHQQSHQQSHQQADQQADQQWDMVVVGGGVVGAAILREAARLKLKALLVEQRDFAWGTSSRSSKMVHGGLRYIATGDPKITRESVHERQRLLGEAPGLIEPMQYLFADRKWQYPGRWMFTALLWIYDVFAGRADHRFLKPDELFMQAPHWNDKGLTGACQYTDAATDDARLVLRILQEAKDDGAQFLNYVAADGLVIEGNSVKGVTLHNLENDEKVSLKAKVVVNATGAWADMLRQKTHDEQGRTPEKKVRPLRGSHVVLPYWRLPVSQSITFMHKKDRRPIFIFPWEGSTVVGTTDLDHKDDLNLEPKMTREELDYILSGIDSQFPSRQISEQDIVSSYAGVRPVIGTGNLNPSAEKRDHCVWDDSGLISVTGGKLTTFRVIALDVLKRAAPYLPSIKLTNWDQRIFRHLSASGQLRLLLPSDQARRMVGRYGPGIVDWLALEASENLQLIPGTHTLWTELKWAAQYESVCHLDDLLLRRTRIGLLLPNAAVAHMSRIRSLCQASLNWTDQQWEEEQQRYLAIWKQYYSLPNHSLPL